jgi:ATPase subunit of ABC transporter with duplicated ATPase domains
VVAVVVVSHDRKFCEALEPTHVMTVEDGVARFESRQLTDDDWRDDVISAQVIHKNINCV